MINAEPRLDVIGAALGERSRALIVTALMDGRAQTAKELAYRARISAQTASFHLQRLVECGILECHPQGRHRYYGLASPEIAEAIETLMVAAPAEHLRRLPTRMSRDMLLARCCYDHLAGRLGVAVAERFAEAGALLPRGGDFSLTPMGLNLLTALGLDGEALDTRTRPLVRQCLDCTERRFHLAGVLGAQLLRHLLAEDWLQRHGETRVLRMTPKGRALFRSKLQLDIDALDPANEGARALS